jgi:hypothetical protein
MQVDHSLAKIITPDFSLQPPVKSLTDDFSVAVANNDSDTYPLAHGPPLSDQDTYLLNCVFRL